MNLCADTDYAVFVKVLKCVFTDVGNISCDFLRAELGITRLCLILLNVDRGKYVLSDYLFINKDSILIVVAFPCHKAYKYVLAERNLAVVRGGAVGNNFVSFDVLACLDNGLLIYAGTVV